MTEISKDPSGPQPARIHLLAAKEAPYVVVIRRKPSRVAHILRWNTQTDELEQGSWFTGCIYEMRSDVSFDGQYMVYLALGATAAESWTGICRPPFLRTVIDWPNDGTWYGGGVFRSPTRLELNGYSLEGAWKAVNEANTRLPFELGVLANPGHGEDEGVLYPRFERDGFHRAGPFGKEKEVEGPSFAVICREDPGWLLRPTSRHPELRVRFRGYFSGRGRVFEWDLPEHPGLLDEHVSWATYDALGQLIVARLGVLMKYRLKDLLDRTPSAVFDLESLERPPRAVGPPKPEESKTAPPPIETVKGNLSDLDVRALIIPYSEAPWVRELHALAGEFLAQALRDWLPEPCEVLRTPAFYLRQHDLVHVAEPPPSSGIEFLRRVCAAAFESASMGTGSSVALKPIGLDAGWPRDEALAATTEAALRYVESDPERRVLLVEE